MGYLFGKRAFSSLPGLRLHIGEYGSEVVRDIDRVEPVALYKRVLEGMYLW